MADESKFVWETRLFPIRPRLGGSTGIGIAHWFEVQVVDDRVYIFGGGVTTIYIECLSLEDGKLLFHFSTDIT